MSTLAQIFGWIGAGALLAGQILQHAGQGTAGMVLTGIGGLLTGGGIHAASKTSGTN